MGIFCQIPLSQVDIQDSLFEANFMPDLTVLKDSIERQGVLNPILVREKNKDSYQIISGFRRFSCAQSLKHRTISVWVADVFHKDLALFERALEENFFARSFNVVEKAMVLVKLQKHFDVARKEILSKYMPRLALPASEKVFQVYLDLMELNPQVQTYVVSHHLPVHIVEDFLRFSQAEQALLLPFLDRVYFSVATLKEFLVWVDEIVIREDLDVKAVLEDAELKKTLNDPLMSSRQKYQNVKEVLKSRRFPRLSHIENKFKDLKKSLNLPLEQSDFFESNRIQMKFSFGDKKELQKWVNRMSLALGKPELEEMFKKI